MFSDYECSSSSDENDADASFFNVHEDCSTSDDNYETTPTDIPSQQTHSSTFANTPSEYTGVSKLKEYLISDNLVMFEASGLKVAEVITMILGYSVRFSLSYKA